jgi:hypothetical protein
MVETVKHESQSEKIKQERIGGKGSVAKKKQGRKGRAGDEAKKCLFS